jgi:hypothetical protein
MYLYFLGVIGIATSFVCLFNRRFGHALGAFIAGGSLLAIFILLA